MPTPRSPDGDKRSEERKKAEQMYLAKKGDIKLVDIAEKLGLPANKVRKWKSMDNWEAKLSPSKEKSKKKPVERSTSKEGNVPRKRGAPKGNKNAVGNKGNPNPTNKTPPVNLKHGGYSAVYWDTLDEEEKELIEEMPKDEEMLLIQQIQLFSVRERRIMKAINKYRNMESPVAITMTTRSEQKRSFKDEDEEALYKEMNDRKIAAGEKLPGNTYDVYTQTDNVDNIIARLESELSNVQSKKTKSIEALYKLRLEKAKMESASAGGDAVDDWISAVLGDNGGINDE